MARNAATLCGIGMEASPPRGGDWELSMSPGGPGGPSRSSTAPAVKSLKPAGAGAGVGFGDPSPMRSESARIQWMQERDSMESRMQQASSERDALQHTALNLRRRADRAEEELSTAKARLTSLERNDATPTPACVPSSLSPDLGERGAAAAMQRLAASQARAVSLEQERQRANLRPPSPQADLPDRKSARRGRSASPPVSPVKRHGSPVAARLLERLERVEQQREALEQAARDFGSASPRRPSPLPEMPLYETASPLTDADVGLAQRDAMQAIAAAQEALQETLQRVNSAERPHSPTRPAGDDGRGVSPPRSPRGSPSGTVVDAVRSSEAPGAIATAMSGLYYDPPPALGYGSPARHTASPTYSHLSVPRGYARSPAGDDGSPLRMQRRIDALESKLNQVQIDTTHRTAQVEQMKIERDAMEVSLNLRERASGALEKRVGDLEAEAAAAKEAAAVQEQAAANVAAERDAALAAHEKLTGELQERLEKHRAVEAQLEGAQAAAQRVGEVEADLGAATRRVGALEEQLSDAHGEAAQQREECASAAAGRDAAMKQAVEAQAALLAGEKKWQAELDRLRAASEAAEKEWQEDVDRLTLSLADTATQLEAKTAAAEEGAREMEKLAGELAEVKAAAAAKQAVADGRLAEGASTIKVLQDTLRDVTEQRDTAQKNLTVHIRSHEGHHDDLRASLRVAEERLQHGDSQRQKLQESLDTWKADHQSLEKERDALLAEKKDLLAAHESLQVKHKTAESELASVAQSLAEMTVAHGNLAVKLQDEERSAAQASLIQERAQRALEAAEAQGAALAGDLDTARQDTAALRAESAQFEQSYLSVKKSLGDVLADRDAIHKANTHLLEEKATVVASEQTLMLAKLDADRRVEDMKSAEHSLLAEMTAAEGRINELEASEQALLVGKYESDRKVQELETVNAGLNIALRDVELKLTRGMRHTALDNDLLRSTVEALASVRERHGGGDPVDAASRYVSVPRATRSSASPLGTASPAAALPMGAQVSPSRLRMGPTSVQAALAEESKQRSTRALPAMSPPVRSFSP
eukprot:TRINITY_DN8625_c2_g3_i1.p1 TRINITY_DN8625_c2_g3~~TRINITY_DN8625_c2_g3_i1.p1  ORF type:complete len:1050 (+),score=371.94 TRINITY_DN8625_c2_g3_i1:141-3290(+)